MGLIDWANRAVGREPASAPLLHRGDRYDDDEEDDSSTLHSDRSGSSMHFPERYQSESVRNMRRYFAFACAIISALCGGSISAYSLYGHLFQERLRYTQLQVNTVSIAAELAMYLPVPIFGYICDRVGPAPLSLFGGATFAGGYLLAAFTYRSGAMEVGVPEMPNGWPFSVMVIAFILVGMATTSMYISAVATCAKNFGRGKHKGLALAAPIAAFGLSGMWQSQVGSRLLYETLPDGSKGDVDPFQYFVFLAIALLAAGLLGTVGLRVVGEDELIDDALEALETSGLIEDSPFFTEEDSRRNYGSFAEPEAEGPESEQRLAVAAKAREAAREALEAKKKTFLLNEETRIFLKDHTMWLLAFGLFLVTGPGEAFINNLGTIIGTLYPPIRSAAGAGNPTNAATHVSIVAVTSTAARLVTGTLTDFLAPISRDHENLAASFSSLQLSRSHPAHDIGPSRRITISRVTFLLTFALLLSVGQAVLASGAVQGHGEYFWIVSSLIGAGYGAVFSITPIIISVIWGVENFGTNWGIVTMVPAAGATLWGVIYSWVYQWAAANGGGVEKSVEDVLCYGKACYSSTFWAMAASVWLACALWVWAWKGPNGWTRRGIAV